MARAAWRSNGACLALISGHIAFLNHVATGLLLAGAVQFTFGGSRNDFGSGHAEQGYVTSVLEHWNLYSKSCHGRAVTPGGNSTEYPIKDTMSLL